MIGNNTAMTNLANAHSDANLYVPLQFFFNRNEGLALPLIALQYHDVRINFEFRNLSDCVCYSGDVNYNTDLAPNLKFLDASLYVDYVFLDTEERKRFAQTSHEYLIEQLQYTGDESVNQTSQKFKLNFNHPTKALYWGVRLGKYTSGQNFLAYDPSNVENQRLHATRRFVLKFCAYTSGTSHSFTPFASLLGTQDNKFSLNPVFPVNSPLGKVFYALDARYMVGTAFDVDNVSVFGRLLTDQELSTTVNDWVSGSISSGQSLTVLPESQGHSNFDVCVRQWDNYAINLDKKGNTMLSGNIQLNGHDRYSVRDGNYHNYVQPWQHHSNTPSDGINMYSFGLHPQDHQPSGTCNMSRIDNATLVLTFDPAVQNGDNKISVYAYNYNVLRIMAGMGGLAYSN